VVSGETTFFFGLASTNTHLQTTGFLVDTTGARTSIDVHVPSRASVDHRST
jgi:hypothetical protein